MGITENISAMEPMLPPEGRRKLEDLALDLATKASGLASQLPPAVRRSIGDLVRSMNCYYTNLIEGHDTHPRDIDRALSHADYSTDPQKRALQHEAVAHIEVQWLIDHREDLQADTTSVEYLLWLHREFCSRLPEEMLWVRNPDTGELLHLVPGELRKGWVQVGRHIPPAAESLPRFLDRFAEAYHIKKLSRVRQIIALGAAHHRLLWIHPFYDGNVGFPFCWPDNRGLSAAFLAATCSFSPVDRPRYRNTPDSSPLDFSAESVCNRRTEM
jgi:Fic family protein